MVNIYFDFDGTLYTWDTTKSLEDVGKSDYPLNQKEHAGMIWVARQLEKDYPGSVKIASAVLNDGCKKSKIRRIESDISPVVARNSIFTEFGQDKVSLMNTSGNQRVGIKAYNGINGTKGRWRGYSIHTNAFSTLIYKQLKGIIEFEIKEFNGNVDFLIDDFTDNLIAWDYCV